jgi:hypothetical protein
MKSLTNVTSENWLMCNSTNNGYLDCPVKDNQNKNFIVAIYNPSLITQ